MSRIISQRTRPSRSPPARSQRWINLLLVMAPIVGSFVYNQGIRLPFLDGCPLMRAIGIPCPAWGLTRSFMAVARGEFTQAFAYHWFGPILFGGFALACLHFLLELLQQRRIRAFYVPLVRNPKLQISAFLLLMIYHGFRLHHLAHSGELYTWFMQSPIGQWWY
ncbi:DUF2752 domain-containing protein [Egbenema bharatensis]|uniref:DUF2752 domain-containing protein n=1 Tax=Egbenema bharatensis TaxID=3463334 RepID=UPI003A8687E7